MTEFTEVAVTLAVPGRYHYIVPARLALRARVGARVLVPFGRQKVTGVVVRADAPPPPSGVAAVELSDVLDDEPALPGELVELCLWIADYYEAPPGEVLRAALPAGSGVAARRVVELTDAGRAAAGEAGGALPARMRELLVRLERAPLPVAGTSAAARRLVAALAARGFVREGEQRDAARVKLRRERVAAVVAGVDLEAARAALGRAKTRRAVLDTLASAPGQELAVAALGRMTSGASAAVKQLVAAGIVRTFEREAELIAAGTGDAMAAVVGGAVELTAGQREAVRVIEEQLAGGELQPVLLHGVTGSGKTEVYLRVIASALAAGKTAIVLVPEISLTPQLAARFRARFGDRVAILHSGMSEQARLGEWSRLRRGEARIAVGARSAVFAPLSEVGVIVVDEEHDGSFKQDDGVRYHARDVALVRAQRAGAVCVLGSATPSLESYAHAERGTYRLLVLTQRPTARPMPSVEIVDLRT
ncbi:MAG TPA: primosomal protein N', partial [Kofleriaceae bacterium]|nr:primosomal protein N' [Kofleriaceae bacterium]